MSKLEELIAQLCPDGVEYKRLENCCTILDKKRKPITKSARQKGEYPYYGANGIQDYVADYIFEGTFMLVGEDGSVITPAGKPVVNWVSGKIWVNNHAHVVEEKSGISLRYLYHFIQTVDVTTYIHGNIPKFTGTDFKSLLIPVPPLPVQQEIVRILDRFTTYKAELEAELEARRKQYEYYRDSLLSFAGDENVKWISLKDISNKISSGGTPNKAHPEYYDGNIPWLRTQDVCFNEIYNVDTTISEKGLMNSSAKWIPANCVIIAISGATAGRSAVNKFPLTTNQHCCNIEINSEIALYKYVFYCVMHAYEKIKFLGRGARGDLNSEIIGNFKIPVPPLPVQQRIVSILDRFDVLCNDLTTGLPAEIAMRQKQYEYYRDKLLTFKEKKA